MRRTSYTSRRCGTRLSVLKKHCAKQPQQQSRKANPRQQIHRVHCALPCCAKPPVVTTRSRTSSSSARTLPAPPRRLNDAENERRVRQVIDLFATQIRERFPSLGCPKKARPSLKIRIRLTPQQLQEAPLQQRQEEPQASSRKRRIKRLILPSSEDEDEQEEERKATEEKRNARSSAMPALKPSMRRVGKAKKEEEKDLPPTDDSQSPCLPSKTPAMKTVKKIQATSTQQPTLACRPTTKLPSKDEDDVEEEEDIEEDEEEEEESYPKAEATRALPIPLAIPEYRIKRERLFIRLPPSSRYARAGKPPSSAWLSPPVSNLRSDTKEEEFEEAGANEVEERSSSLPDDEEEEGDTENDITGVLPLPISNFTSSDNSIAAFFSGDVLPEYFFNTPSADFQRSRSPSPSPSHYCSWAAEEEEDDDGGDDDGSNVSIFIVE